MDAYLWYRRHIQGDICTLVPFGDPLDASHLLVALTERIAAHSEDHIEIGAEEFDHWMNAATRTHPNYNAIKCFRELRKGLSLGRAQMAAPGCFIYGEGPKVVIDVYHRPSQGARMTRGQMHRFMVSLLAQDRINQNVIASLRGEALSQDWPSPFPALRDDQPVEIIINQVSLTQRLRRLLARIG